MKVTRLLVGAVLGLGLSGVAHAAPKDDARRYFIAGIAAAKEQDFQTALDYFLRAQAVYPHPATLYNIARSYQDLGQLEEAIEYYELYADAVPEKAEDVAPVIDVLRVRLGRQSETAAATTPAAGTTLDSAELERLRAIAEELASISQQMQERADEAVAVAAPAPEPGEAPPDVTSGDGSGGGGDFLSDAYERVVVTASRYGQSPLDSPSTISVITEQDIKMSGATNVADLLRRAVGMEVMSLASSQPEISIRGFNRKISNKVLILVDGRAVYWDILATPLWSVLPVSLEEIERIEITRGPGSAVYGANAVTGVVNIITRLPGEGDNIVHVDVGQPGYGRGTALAAGRKDRTSYRFATGFEQLGRWSADYLDAEGSSVQIAADNNTSVDKLLASGRIDRTFSDKGLVSVAGSYVTGSGEFYAIGALGNYSLRQFDAGFARVDVGWGNLLLRSYYNALVADVSTFYAYSDAKSLPNTVDSHIVDNELSGVFDFETGAVTHKVSAGLGYRYKQVAWSYLEAGDAPISEHHFSGFAQDDARIGAVSLVGALRVDRHPLVDISETISPRGAVVWRARETTSVRGSFGTSFRSPSFAESYLSLEQPNANEPDAFYITAKGDRELVPERILTAELGVRDESSDIHTADAVVYYNRVTDLISLSSVDTTVSFYDEANNGFFLGSASFLNTSSVYTGYGLELDGHLFPVFGLDINGNVHLQRIIEDTGSAQIDENGASAAKVNLSAAYTTPFRLDVSAGVHYVSVQDWRLREYNDAGEVIIVETEIPARTIPTARLAYRPLPDESLELAATVWNPAGLIDGNGFREHPEGQLVSGRVFGSVIYRF